MNYDFFGIEMTCKRLPSGCNACPFQAMQGSWGVKYSCSLLDHEGVYEANGQQEHRLKNCPLRQRTNAEWLLSKGIHLSGLRWLYTNGVTHVFCKGHEIGKSKGLGTPAILKWLEQEHKEDGEEV